MTFKENLLQFMTLEEVDELLKSLNNEDNHAVLLNPSKMSAEEFISLFPEAKKHPYVDNAFIYDKNKYQLGKNIYHELGCYYIQEPSAMMVASLIDVKKDDVVLDMCAAPGGKSIGVSFKNQENGLIISNDLSRSRSNMIVSNIERLGLKNVLVTNNDFENIYDSFLEKFDVVILDAPCSGSGMFRKDDKMIDDWSINKVYKFAEIQKRLILIAYKILKSGGILSYSTCSYSIEEDEDVIHYLLENSDAQIKELPLIKDAYINKNDPVGIRMMPHKFNGEGQYICQIVKPGNKKENSFNNFNKYQKYLPNYTHDKSVEKYGNTYFMLNKIIPIKYLNVVRYGVKIGEENKGIFKFDISYARAISKEDFDYIELDEKQLKDYLYGNVLYINNKYKGYILLTYKNKTVDIAKTDGSQIKNYYPKGLRKKFD